MSLSQSGDLMFTRCSLIGLLQHHRFDFGNELFKTLASSMRQEHRIFDFVEGKSYLASRKLPGLILFQVLFSLFDRSNGKIFTRVHRGKVGLQSEEILLQQRVVLVIMTSSALEPERQKCIRGGFRHVIQNLLPLSLDIALIVLVDPMSEKHRSD